MEEKAKPVEVMPEKSEKPLEEDLSWEDKEEKIGEEIKVENETKPGNRKFVTLIYIAHMIKCALHQVLRSLYVHRAKNESVEIGLSGRPLPVLFYCSSCFKLDP